MTLSFFFLSTHQGGSVQRFRPALTVPQGEVCNCFVFGCE